MVQLLINHGDEGKEWMVGEIEWDLDNTEIRAIVHEAAAGGGIYDPNNPESRLPACTPSPEWIEDAYIEKSNRVDGQTVLLRPKVAFGG